MRPYQPVSPISIRLAAGLCLGVPLLAQAQLAPFAITLGETVTHDDNLLHAVAGQEQADWQSDTRARFNYADRIGRHNAKAWATADFNRYRYNQQLNNNGYDLGGEFDWTAPNLWSGQLGVDANSSLYRSGLTGGQAYQDKSMRRYQRAYSRASVGGVTALSFQGGLEVSRSTNSATALAYNDTNQWTGDLGAVYAQSPDLRLSATARYSDGKYPNYVPTEDTFRREDVNLGVTWTPSGFTTLQGQFGYAHESHSLLSARSYWNGRLQGTWLPTGHVTLSATLSRDASQSMQNQNAWYANVGNASSNTDLLQQTLTINNTANLAARWAWTGKIGLNGAYSRMVRDYNGVLAGSSLVDGTDAVNQYQLGVDYQANQAARLGCSVTRVSHASGTLAAAGFIPYVSNAYSCLVEFSLR
jgi:hypothetical protein